MNRKIKGFASVLLIAALAVVTGLGFYAYKKFSVPHLGAAVTDTQLTDTLGTFRTNVNSSIDNINTELESVSTTVHNFGNIASENAPLVVNKGGLGTSTVPTNLQIPVASGTTPTWKTLATSTGVTLTQTATSVIIGTAGFDNTANIAFTGNNSHSGTESFSSSTSFSATTTAPYLAPPGAIEAYASSTAPNGWLLCNGQSVATSTYPSLFSLIGYTYGGSGANFLLPNLGGRFIAGPSSTLSTTVGATGGATSTVAGPFTLQGATGVGGANPQVSSLTTNSQVIPTIPPYMIFQYIIKF